MCHRDYTSLAHSQIRLYDESLEFWNAGALPIGLTTNKMIAEAFFYMGLIEQWGSGTTRIATELQDSEHQFSLKCRVLGYLFLENQKL